MKRIWTFLIVIFLAISLSACSSSPSTYTVEIGETLFTVNSETSTISDGNHTYAYTLSERASDYHLEIVYPNGSTYWWQTQSSGNSVNGYGGWSDDYDENRYVAGDILRSVLEKEIPTNSSSKNIVVIILLIIFGLLNVVSPYTAWYWEYGWRFKDVEPSDSALVLNRCAGVACLIIAAFMLFI